MIYYIELVSYSLGLFSILRSFYFRWSSVLLLGLSQAGANGKEKHCSPQEQRTSPEHAQPLQENAGQTSSTSSSDWLPRNVILFVGFRIWDIYTRFFLLTNMYSISQTPRSLVITGQCCGSGRIRIIWPDPLTETMKWIRYGSG